MSTEELIEMEDPRTTPPIADELMELQSLDNGFNVFYTPTISTRNSSECSLPLRSYSKWSPKEQGATLVWRDLCVYTNPGSSSKMQNMKRIINNSTGAIQPGNLMALMGAR